MDFSATLKINGSEAGIVSVELGREQISGYPEEGGFCEITDEEVSYNIVAALVASPFIASTVTHNTQYESIIYPCEVIQLNVEAGQCNAVKTTKKGFTLSDVVKSIEMAENFSRNDALHIQWEGMRLIMQPDPSEDCFFLGWGA